MECQFEQVYESTSTNLDLMERFKAGDLLAPVSRLAVVQSAGKGRRGTLWFSEKDRSLTFSLAYPFAGNVPMRQLQALSLVIGYGVLEGIANYYQRPLAELHLQGLSLKWPNDIYIHQSKIGGILIETGQKDAQSIWAIIGVGLNIKTLQNPLQTPYAISALDQLPITKGIDVPIEDIWHDLTKHLLSVIQTFIESNYQINHTAWNALHQFHAQEVIILDQEKPIYSGKVLGINDQGALLLQTPIGIQTVHNGNLSFRNP